MATKRDDDDNDDREDADDRAEPSGADTAEDDGAEGGDGERAIVRSSARELEVGDDVAAAVEGDAEGEEQHAVQALGAQRYVIAAFIIATMLGAYVLGLTIHGVWAWASNRDFFALNLPQAAAVSDESKMTIGTTVGAVLALAYAVRQYRDPEVRAWTDDVAGELTKVKWPTKKDVTSSTIVVIAASTFAMVYLFLLDRLWAFVTGLIYGAGT
jgi:preprotein translocase subunit SecE